MRQDAATYQPFRSHFILEVVASGFDKWAGKELEAKLIEQHGSRGAAGYNIAKGHPASTKQYWYLKRSGII